MENTDTTTELTEDMEEITDNAELTDDDVNVTTEDMQEITDNTELIDDDIIDNNIFRINSNIIKRYNHFNSIFSTNTTNKPDTIKFEYNNNYSFQNRLV